MMRSRIIAISIICLMSILAIRSIESTKIDVDDGLITMNSIEIEVPPTWGPPAEIPLQIPGENLLVPFFNYAGSSFALAWMNSTMDSLNLLLTSSAMERTILEEITLEERVLSGSNGMDVILRDANGAIYGVSIHDKWSDTRTLAASDIIMTGIRGKVILSDITGDDIVDLLHLVPNGTQIEIYEGPLPTIRGKAILSLGSEMDNIVSGMDLTGDGVSELIAWNNDGARTTLEIYHGYSLSPYAYLENNREIRTITHGDLDGDDIDDILIQETGSPSGGLIKVLFGATTDQNPDLSTDCWNLTGNSSFAIREEALVLVNDLDGDGTDDMILSDPMVDSTAGRMILIYGGDFWNISNSGAQIRADSSFIGPESGARLGSGCFIVEDLDGDSLSDIFVLSGSSLHHVGRDRNDPPTVKNIPSFFDVGTGDEVPSVESGSTIGISCVAVDSDPEQVDVLKAEVFTLGEDHRTRSWVFLMETNVNSEVFKGDLQLSLGSIQGRSLGVIENDLVSVMVDGISGDVISINGYAGQSDRPAFLDIDEKVEGIEDTIVTLRYRAWDPEGSTLDWSFVGIPDWLEILVPNDDSPWIRTLTGIPDDGDVGWNNFTITIDDGSENTTRAIELLVINKEPLVTTISMDLAAKEGVNYTSIFSFEEVGGPVFATIEMEGPVNDTWLTVHPNGTVSGIPRNRHVGNWSVRLIVSDIHGGWGYQRWNISVENSAPIVTPPYQEFCKEYEPIILDFDCPDEGDGMTFYFLNYSSRSIELDTYTGEVSLIPTFYNPDRGRKEGFITIRVDVIDIFGGITVQYYQININNTAPVLYPGDLPSILVAGEFYEFDLDSNEEGQGAHYTYYIHSLNTVQVEDEISDYWNTGKITLFPWNAEVGDQQLRFMISDSDFRTSILWNFTVSENLSFIDPKFDLSILKREGDDLILSLDMEENGYQPISIKINVNETGGSSYYYSRNSDEDPSSGEYRLDISRMNRSISVQALLEFEVGPDYSKFLYREYQFQVPAEEKETPGPPIALIIIIIFMLLITAIVTTLLFIERTSYVIQSEIFKGGEIREEEVLSPIQDLPGISFKELSDGIEINRKDLLSTLNELESRGMVRAVEDGTKMRFWPMMGAFVDGPLVLNRNQKLILDVVPRNGNISIPEISRKTGISSRRVEKEVSMLDLKGSVSKKGSGEDTLYYLNSRQKAMLKKMS